MAATALLFNTIPDQDRLGFWANETLRSRKVAEFLDFEKSDIAKVSKVSVKSVRYDEKIPKEVLNHLEQIAIVCSLVAAFFAGDQAKTGLWFRTKNPLLGELSPRDMIRYGRMEKLRQIVLEALAANGITNPTVTVKRVARTEHGKPPKAAPARPAH